MLGKASEIKTLLVEEQGGTKFHETLNRELYLLQECDIINIHFTATPNDDGVTWFNALIIYKEGESNGTS